MGTRKRLLVLFTACGAGVATACAHMTGASSMGPQDAVYSGHGADSVSPETLARFAPAPLPPAVSEKVQAMLDIRGPGPGYLTEDGKHMFFGWRVTGIPQVWRLDGPWSFPEQMTGGEDLTSIVGIAPNDKYVVIQRDRNGEENPGLYIQSTSGGPLVPIQHQKGVQTAFEFVSDDSRWVYFRANDVKPENYVSYRWEVATGKREVVFDQEGLWFIADHRPDGMLLLEKELGSSQVEYWRLDPVSGDLQPVIGQGEREDYIAAFGAAKDEVLVLTPKLGEYRRLYSLKRGELTPVTPEMKHDVADFTIDPQRQRVLYQVNEDGYWRIRAMDAKTFRNIALPNLPPADNYYVGRTSYNGRFTGLSIETKTPQVSYVLDWQRNSVIQWLAPSAPETDTSRFAEATLESYPARDGARIPMFVWRPAQCAPSRTMAPAPDRQPCPVIVIFHGGPEGQAQPGFSPTAQLFVDAGFVVVQPNVRGSEGYGKTWFHADDGPKRLNVITDIEDASRFVRTAWSQNGHAPRIGIYGGSYGGYSALIGMTMFAGAYDAGVELVGISNLVTFLANTAPYRRALRVSEYGDPDKDRDALIKLSPITYVGRVTAPLLMIQGANDPRVPVGEAVQIQTALERKGIPSKLMIFADEGHGAKKRNNLALQLGHALLFFQENLLASNKVPPATGKAP